MALPNVSVFGYDELLLASLEFISQTRTRVSAVVFPSNRKDRRANIIRQKIKEKDYLVLEQPPRRRVGELTEKLRKIKPDLIFVWSYPMILPTEIIEIPKYGCLNLHLGLLPEYRGVNGVRQALLKGEEKTGLTIHLMDAGIDTGDIITRVSFPITPEDDILSLMKKSKEAGLFLLKNCWQQLVSGTAHAIPQDESKARYYSAEAFPPEVIDWTKSNVELHNLIRASVIPFPGVHTFFNGRQLVMRKSVPVENGDSSQPPGTIKKMDSGGIEITTGNGNLLVTAIEMEGEIVPNTKLSDLGLTVGSCFQNA